MAIETVDAAGLVGKPVTVNHGRGKSTVVNNVDSCDVRDGSLLLFKSTSCIIVFGPGEWRSVNVKSQS